MSPSTDLVDVTSVPLSTLRDLHEPILLDGIRRVISDIPQLDRDEIQEPGSSRAESDTLLTGLCRRG